MKQGISAICIITQHVYSFLAVALLHIFVNAEEHCLQSQKDVFFSLEVPAEVQM